MRRASQFPVTAATYLLFTVSLSGAPAAAAGGQAWCAATLDNVDVGYYVHRGDTSVAIDHNNKIHISYRGPGRTLKYATNVSGVWTTETVFSAAPSVARENSIVVDSSNLPHISFSYDDGHAEDLMYARKLPEGNWEVISVFTTNSAGMENDIALDSQDFVHISHWQWNGADLLYSTNGKGEWLTETLDDAY